MGHKKQGQFQPFLSTIISKTKEPWSAQIGH